MNTLILLAATAWAPAANPSPVVDSRPAAVPAYGNVGATEWAAPVQESRPRFFARLRGLFSRKSQGVGIDGSQTMEPPLSVPQGVSTGSTSTTVVPGNSSSGISTPSTFRAPAFTPSAGAAQRMPAGQPF